MTAPIVAFADVSKRYRAGLRPGSGVDALRGVSLAIEPGEVFALLGPNRAGKTTLLKVLLGLTRPSGGEVSLLGRPIAERGSLARVGYMHENQAFPRYLTPTTLLDYYGALALLSGPARRARAAALLDRVGLADRARDPIARFSKGMVQRLALAQALLAGPDLLVLDEPSEGLDLDARRLLHEVVAEQRDAGKTVLLVSHSLGEVARVCDRLAVLVEGRLAYLGPLSPLLVDRASGRAQSLETALTPIYRSLP